MESNHRILEWQCPFPLRVVSRNGDVPDAILHELREGGCGTLAMGQRGLFRIEQCLLGSVSAAVVKGLTTQTLALVD